MQSKILPTQINDSSQPWIWITQLLTHPETFILVLLFLGFWVLWSTRKHLLSEPQKRTLDAPGFPPIEPLDDNFDWKTTEPLQFRPFKLKYHLTMALETLNPTELIPMDKTYKKRLALRNALLRDYHDIVVAVNDNHDNDSGNSIRVREAVMELYTFLMGTYLPGRYPGMFRLHHHHHYQHKMQFETVLENLVTGEIWPVVPLQRDTIPTIRALETLSRVVDEDFLILLPEQKNEKKNTTTTTTTTITTEEDPKYTLQAYTTCFPSGFNPRQKLGLRLSTIHDPVPGYHEKLEKSMDRFFAKLETGKYVKRVNWSITTNEDLFAAFGDVHGVEGEGLEEKMIRPGELDVETTLLRCERQTLHRLPKTRAIVFAFHTYTYPIRSVKDEGLGEDLARAIDGLKEGSVPRMHFYKRGPVWGEAVKQFLRS